MERTTPFRRGSAPARIEEARRRRARLSEPREPEPAPPPRPAPSVRPVRRRWRGALAAGVLGCGILLVLMMMPSFIELPVADADALVPPAEQVGATDADAPTPEVMATIAVADPPGVPDPQPLYSSLPDMPLVLRLAPPSTRPPDTDALQAPGERLAVITRRARGMDASRPATRPWLALPARRPPARPVGL